MNPDPNLLAFEYLLAQYRRRVYEQYFLQQNDRETELLPQSGARKLTILSIEDKADEWFITRWALLQQFPGAELVWLADPAQVIPHLEACRQREEDLPSLILLDLYLPTSTVGLTVLQGLKSHPLFHRIPTIVLSRSNHYEDIADVYSHFANSYIVKPTDYHEWVKGLSRLHRYC
ncbi:response regulator [Spirosoma sp. HMF4905]|uniref:Response regulator n=1 Tax=Spirosoma arboris TaxID=2682092 RepID=A0A7K1SNZ4_9BACT|nr:response regulator [Spirosoma arboris]MVM35525.1 response regulator [Spirosoma arboris]